jgi:hypothetical protein
MTMSSIQQACMAGNTVAAPYFTQRRKITPPHQPDGTQLGIPAKVEARDPRTWPKGIKAKEIEELLKPILKDGAVVNFTALESLANDVEALEAINSVLAPKLRPLAIGLLNVDQYVHRHLPDSSEDVPKLIEREDWCELAKAKICKGQPTNKVHVVSLYSCRGSGKTAFVKHMAKVELKAWTAAGRVIVRDCSAARRGVQHWVKLCEQDKTLEALCSLIRDHVKEVTGQEMDPTITQAKDAYASWIAHTATRFCLTEDQSKALPPIILLDTCEVLATVNSPSQKHKSGTELTALEAFCIRVPNSYSILACGCTTSIEKSDVMLRDAVVTELPALKPLSVEGYRRAASECWNTPVDPELAEPLHELGAGLHRLLRRAHEPFSVSLGRKAWNAVSIGLDAWHQNCRELFNETTLRSVEAYSLFLASTTKLSVQENEPVIIPPGAQMDPTRPAMTYRLATERSLAARIGDKQMPLRRVVVPPILFTDASMFDITPPIKPSQLHPLLDTENLLSVRSSAMERGKLFEKPLLYSVYGRYLLTSWRRSRNGAGDADWVSLEEVFQGALSDRGRSDLRGTEVCLKNGVDEKPDGGSLTNAKPGYVTWTGGVNPTAHHDSYLWCRQGVNGQPQPMALQLGHHGDIKAKYQLRSQTLRRKHKAAPKRQRQLELPLLVAYKDLEARNRGEANWDGPQKIVFIDASAMSSIAWLDLVSDSGKAAKRK